MIKTVLICTVGGSHQPIVTALKESQPDYTYFICTGKDESTGRNGSDTQIIGKGNVIKAHFDDIGPSLPNIPAQVALASDQYEIVHVLPDDLDSAVETIADVIANAMLRFPEARLLGDYTGGTKSMTAALALAAVESTSVELQIVRGVRTDLVKVQDETQYSATASIEKLRVRRDMSTCVSLWRTYGYGSCVAALDGITRPKDNRMLAEWSTAKELSEAFDAWDRFDHGRAKARLERYRSRFGQQHANYYTALDLLTSSRNDTRPELARLWDLWRNAERRAEQRRYDDAVARVYRLLEWTAQWILRTQANIDTSDLPATIAETVPGLARNKDGKYQVGLVAAWNLVRVHTPGVAGEFASQQEKILLNHIQARNQSILAHGYAPVDEQTWSSLAAWLSEQFLPVLKAESDRVRLPNEIPQLPTDYADFVAVPTVARSTA